MQVWSVLSVMGVIELGGWLSGIMRKFCFHKKYHSASVYIAYRYYDYDMDSMVEEVQDYLFLVRFSHLLSF